MPLRRGLVLLIALIAGLSLLVQALPSRAANGPVITSATIDATVPLTTTLHVLGSGLGSHAPYTGDSPYLLVHNNTQGWNAGNSCGGLNQVPSCNGGADTVTVFVVNWQDTNIFGGFGGDYGSGSLVFRVGDSVTIDVWNPQTGSGPASCTLTIGPTVSSCSSAPSAPPPSVTVQAHYPTATQPAPPTPFRPTLALPTATAVSSIQFTDTVSLDRGDGGAYSIGDFMQVCVLVTASGLQGTANISIEDSGALPIQRAMPQSVTLNQQLCATVGPVPDELGRFVITLTITSIGNVTFPHQKPATVAYDVGPLANPATLQVSSGSALAGTLESVAGSDFTPGCAATVQLDNDRNFGPSPVASDGTFLLTFTLPVDIATGLHTLLATDACGGAALADFDVTQAAPPPTTAPALPVHTVVVFVQGLDSQLTNGDEGSDRFCPASPEVGEGAFACIKQKLYDDYGYTADDFLEYSYNGGTADSAGWHPRDYSCSDVVNESLTNSADMLHRMLVGYAHAHTQQYTQYVIIGHSLGGMVAFADLAQESSQSGDSSLTDPYYAVSGVITIDSPLAGVSLSNTDGLRSRLDAAGAVNLECFAGTPIATLNALTANRDQTNSDNQNTVYIAQQAGISVYTLGNSSDVLYTGEESTQVVQGTNSGTNSPSDYGWGGCTAGAVVLYHDCIPGHAALLSESGGVAAIAAYVGNQQGNQ